MLENDDDLLSKADKIVEQVKLARARVIHAHDQYTATQRDELENALKMNEAAAKRIRELEEEVERLKREIDKLQEKAKGR